MPRDRTNTGSSNSTWTTTGPNASPRARSRWARRALRQATTGLAPAQSFSIIRYTDPNTGKTTACATYSAQLIGSGKARYTLSTAAPGTLMFDAFLRDSRTSRAVESGSTVRRTLLGSTALTSTQDFMIWSPARPGRLSARSASTGAEPIQRLPLTTDHWQLIRVIGHH
jgi:hypothetical protein